MKKIELIMPKLGESVMEATILNWLKNPGEKIRQDESVLEVATDKVDTEIPSEYEGVLGEILAQKGDVVQIGKPIAIIVTDAQDIEQKDKATDTVEPVIPEIPHALEKNGKNGTPPALPLKHTSRFYSPLVKTIAKEEHIHVAELDTIPGTGNKGRVTKKDMLTYLHQRKTVAASSLTATSKPVVSVPVDAEDEIIQMDRMRRIIAERMVESKQTAPHVTSFVEVDVTELVAWRSRIKEEFKRREKESFTYTPLFVEAIVKALQDFPGLNVQIDGDRIIRKKNIHIGIAVALPSGNLIVPVIKHADRYNLTGLIKQVNDLARRARENQLSPDELTGGTFTLSNVGSFGSLMGTPIIVRPQVGILAAGVIQKKPAVIETQHGDAISIRHKMFLSHSYDHRIIDGALGGMFAQRVARHLEQCDTTRHL